MRFYLGTYTSSVGRACCCELRGDNGMRVLQRVPQNPTYAIANARHDRLFCVSKRLRRGNGGSAASFALRGAPVLLSRQNALGEGRVTCAFRPTSGFCIWPIIPPAA